MLIKHTVLFRNLVEHSFSSFNISKYNAISVPAAFPPMVAIGNIMIEINIIKPSERIPITTLRCGPVTRIVTAQADHVQLLQSSGSLEVPEVKKRQLAVLTSVTADRAVGAVADLICSIARDIDEKPAV